MDIVGDRSHARQFTKRGTRSRVFKSNLVGRTEIAISGATDLQIGPSRRQNIRIDEYYVIVKQYCPYGGCVLTDWRKSAAVLHQNLRADRCSKRDISSSRTRNLEVEDFLERCFSYLQVV